MSDEHLYADARGPWVNMNAGEPGGWFEQIVPEVEPFARAWERACEAASRADNDLSGMGLLRRYVRPLMDSALRAVNAFRNDPDVFVINTRKISP